MEDLNGAVKIKVVWICSFGNDEIIEMNQAINFVRETKSKLKLL